MSRSALTLAAYLSGSVFYFFSTPAFFAHGFVEGDKGYIQKITSANVWPFMYLGSRHKVTGYDHLMFLLGVILFLYKLKHVALYVSLFALGHSTTLLAGFCLKTSVSAYLIAAIIGLSIVYKALDNQGPFSADSAFSPVPKQRP